MLERPSQAQPRVVLDVIVDDDRWGGIANIEDLVVQAADAVSACWEKGKGGEATLLLSTDAHVAQLNKQFRGKGEATNVLSFPPGPGGPMGELGDIVLALETVDREAREQEISVEQHVQHLVVHGILHLAGYDHDTPSTAEIMENLEIRILSSLGIANPYTAALETSMKE